MFSNGCFCGVAVLLHLKQARHSYQSQNTKHPRLDQLKYLPLSTMERKEKTCGCNPLLGKGGARVESGTGGVQFTCLHFSLV
mmetsp:Transcript_8336/g.10304  ORF Transcript_8336/g.10304 Transcript_8336/m.10304 type:complete len:82 (-) Transcript_8336:96-341(-)